MAEQPNTLTIDQALFGYADGHRQLAASIELSAEEAYELATRSDLVANARLGPKESYMCGFAMKRGNSFAMIKTWLAPEMKRPGCVWSHVLILPRSFLVGQVNLGVLQGFFRRPELSSRYEGYRKRIAVRRLANIRPADADEVRNVMSAYYGSGLLECDHPPGEATGRALLAMWSQQWPKLRSDFGFRTVFDLKGSRERDLLFAVNVSFVGVERGISSAPNDEWLSAAVADAVSSTITPLRRFLWRYGRDVAHPREAFKPLLDLYLSTKHNAGSNKVSGAVLASFPEATDAATLKRDLLGIRTGAPSLIRRLNGAGFVKLATEANVLTNDLVQPSELRDAIESFGKEDFVRVILAICAPRKASRDSVCIKEAVSASVDADVLADPSLPRDFVIDVLRLRPELLGDFAVERLPAEEIVELLDVAPNRKTLGKLLKRLLQSPPTASAVDKIDAHLGETFVVAIRMSAVSDVLPGWREVFLKKSKAAFSEALPMLDGSFAVARAVALIGYSKDVDVSPVEVAGAADRRGMPASQEERMGLDAYLLALSLRGDLSASIAIVLDVIARLRPLALADRLSPRVRALLDENLPQVSEGWDFNKRLLKVLRRACRENLPVSDALANMALSEHELSYVLDRDETLIEALINRFMWPFAK